jgi:hypothetical protein
MIAKMEDAGEAILPRLSGDRPAMAGGRFLSAGPNLIRGGSVPWLSVA